MNDFWAIAEKDLDVNEYSSTIASKGDFLGARDSFERPF